MTQTSNKLLKVTGILMIISGVLGIVAGILAMIGIGAVAGALGLEISIGAMVLLTVLAIVGAIVNLIAGILGVTNASKPEKAMICIVFGILSLVLVSLGNITDFVAGDGFNFLNLLRGVLLPVLYIIGAFQNKKLVA